MLESDIDSEALYDRLVALDRQVQKWRHEKERHEKHTKRCMTGRSPSSDRQVELNPDIMDTLLMEIRL